MKQRVISAIVAAVIVIPIYLLGGWVFNLGVVAIGASAYLEILKLKVSHNTIPNSVRVIGFLCLELIVLSGFDLNFSLNGIAYLSLGTGLLLLIPAIFDEKERYTTRDAFYLTGFITIVGLFLNILITIRNQSNGEWLLLYLVMIAILTDTFAYIIGSLIGKHKLIPSVSPKKSVEGSVAGSLIGTIIPVVYYQTVIGSNLNIIIVIIMTLILSIVGQIGDLYYSKIKRENKIKDFSNIMPGHGGILDRLDSLSFITIAYVVIVNIINLII